VDEWNPILSQRFAETTDAHEALRERVSAAILAVLFGLAVAGWLLSI
jgi:hypothetical protein